MTNSISLDLINDYISAYNQFDIEKMLSLFHDDCIFTSISGGVQTALCSGKSELRLLAIKSVSYFSERTQTIKNVILGNDKTAIEISYTGVLKKDLSDTLKAGQTIKLLGASIFIIKAGKIYRLTDYS